MKKYREEQEKIEKELKDIKKQLEELSPSNRNLEKKNIWSKKIFEEKEKFLKDQKGYKFQKDTLQKKIDSIVVGKYSLKTIKDYETQSKVEELEDLIKHTRFTKRDKEKILEDIKKTEKLRNLAKNVDTINKTKTLFLEEKTKHHDLEEEKNILEFLIQHLEKVKKRMIKDVVETLNRESKKYIERFFKDDYSL